MYFFSFRECRLRNVRQHHISLKKIVPLIYLYNSNQFVLKNIVKKLTTEDFLKLNYMLVYSNHKILFEKKKCKNWIIALHIEDFLKMDLKTGLVSCNGISQQKKTKITIKSHINA